MLDEATRKAVAALFRTHFAGLLDFATSLSKNDGGDIVAEAYELIVEGRRAYDPHKPFEPFARGVIDSIYKNRRKVAHRAMKRTSEITEEHLSDDAGADDQLALAETGGDPLREALMARCDATERAYVALLEEYVFDVEEQAERLNVTQSELSKIKRRVEYALERVEDELAKAERREDMALGAMKKP